MAQIKIRVDIIPVIFGVITIVSGVLLLHSKRTGKAPGIFQGTTGTGGYVQEKKLNLQKPAQYYVPEFPANGFLICSDLLVSVSNFISDY